MEDTIYYNEVHLKRPEGRSIEIRSNINLAESIGNNIYSADYYTTKHIIDLDGKEFCIPIRNIAYIKSEEIQLE